jgi:hypothetical protein
MFYNINGAIFSCLFDALEYREHLDAHYIPVVWTTYERV